MRSEQDRLVCAISDDDPRGFCLGLRNTIPGDIANPKLNGRLADLQQRLGEALIPIRPSMEAD